MPDLPFTFDLDHLDDLTLTPAGEPTDDSRAAARGDVRAMARMFGMDIPDTGWTAYNTAVLTCRRCGCTNEDSTDDPWTDMDLCPACDREPADAAEARQWVLTQPAAALCACRGSGAYLDTDGLTWRDCPHHCDDEGKGLRTQAAVDFTAGFLGIEPRRLHGAMVSRLIARGGR